MNDIAIYGAGGFGREMAVMIEQINRQSREWQLIGFFDDGMVKGELVDGLPIMGGIKEANQHETSLAVVIAIANPEIRRHLTIALTNELISFPVLAHPNAILGSVSNFFGEGSIITANCVLTTGVVLGEFVIMNLATTVGHDVKIGSFCSIMPGCHISGNVAIGEGSLLGTGVKVLQNLQIGRGCTIGAGAVVTRNQPDNILAVGIPARKK